MDVQEEQLLSPAVCIQSLSVCSAYPTNTHSRALIHPRSSSFVTTKTCRSSVPHCRSRPRSRSSRCWIVFSSHMSKARILSTVTLRRERWVKEKDGRPRPSLIDSRAAVVEGCLRPRQHWRHSRGFRVL